MQTIIGIDVGETGAVCALFFSDKKLNHWDAQTFNKFGNTLVDFKQNFSSALKLINPKNENVFIALEKPFGIRSQGNMFPYFRKFGWIEMCLYELYSKEPEYLYPSQWQSILYNRQKSKTAKELSQQFFNQHSSKPEIKHKGIIDAFCIAYAYALKLKIIEVKNGKR